ncbi:hypothetical protein GQ55_1G336400 [Panicum hallii var. hallii]|uniref:Uncharacterized protein n=1 Tax=Panicum hallii var. hallii TaxID=1504633 RepID=A0A2T7FAA3_9POAL|nr:hypothetical protein GQ55_1G336400 [Panicum hallii var. hallii]
MLSRRCKKLGCSILLSPGLSFIFSGIGGGGGGGGVQDIIDLKKGYLRHAACDGTRF